MNLGFKRKLFRFVRRHRRDRVFILAVSTALLLISLFVYTSYIQNKRLTVNPVTYAPLLQLIAKVESKGNYNAYFGNAANSSIDFTNMSVKEVMEWQSEYVQQGSPSNAVGKYQIVSTTLAGLVRELNIDTNKKFDKTMQDTMAIALLERRGAVSYVNNELSRDQFAANLAKEWAALPKVVGENPHDSYYASDGLNKSLVSIDEVRRAIEPISAK